MKQIRSGGVLVAFEGGPLDARTYRVDEAPEAVVVIERSAEPDSVPGEHPADRLLRLASAQPALHRYRRTGTREGVRRYGYGGEVERADAGLLFVPHRP
ncbi:hypothetical protein LG943_21285 [Streptomonospora sp. S1-112]|uniref:Uncharacterized protein n=1 Tax=Streptomonospora mangrovi TaxID=2883123 RepID=A0A9X3NN61_9ACTN|nr:hypothetical protein [Streptomonospora mangrovi]MDA0566827.1 hypothetical protein [Streptomonospora mangrovi]